MPIAQGVSAPPAGKIKTSSAAKPAAKNAKTAERAAALEGIGGLAQAGLIAGRQYADAQAVGMHWPGIATELATLAQTEEVIARFVDPLIKAGPYTALAMAVLPLVAQVAVNHKALPAGTMNTLPGDVLGAQMQMAVQQQQIEMRQQQQQQQAELDRLQAQMDRTEESAVD